MPWFELAAGAYVGFLGAFVDVADNFLSRMLFKAPMFPVCAALIADALTRLHIVA